MLYAGSTARVPFFHMSMVLCPPFLGQSPLQVWVMVRRYRSIAYRREKKKKRHKRAFVLVAFTRVLGAGVTKKERAYSWSEALLHEERLVQIRGVGCPVKLAVLST